MSSFQSLVQLFFTERLRSQLGASPHTITAHRDTFRLLLKFASERLRRTPSQVRSEDLDAPFLSKFLEHLERTRRNCARTRNNRLAALHAFFRYVAVSEPALALHCQRVLAIPAKRFASPQLIRTYETLTANHSAGTVCREARRHLVKSR
jgi:integrase/recombinase XerD